MTLLAFAAERRAATGDRYLPPTRRSAANQPHAAAAVARWDRQIDVLATVS